MLGELGLVEQGDAAVRKLLELIDCHSWATEHRSGGRRSSSLTGGGKRLGFTSSYPRSGPRTPSVAGHEVGAVLGRYSRDAGFATQDGCRLHDVSQRAAGP